MQSYYELDNLLVSLIFVIILSNREVTMTTQTDNTEAIPSLKYLGVNTHCKTGY